MRVRHSLLPILVVVLSACEARPTEPIPAEPGVVFDGLAGHRVSRLRIFDGALYALTDSGAYRRSLSAAASSWTHLGPGRSRANDIVALNSSEFLIAVQPGEAGAPSLFRSTDRGLTWHDYQRDFAPGNAWKEVRTLRRLADGTLLAGGANYVIARSVDRGGSWTRVFGDWNLGALGVHAISAADDGSGLLYAGGEAGFFSPFVLRSVDAGTGWTAMPLDLGGDNAVYAIHATPGGLVVLATEGYIVRSSDGGTNWETVAAPADYPYFSDVIRGNSAEELWMAGAANHNLPQPIKLWYSPDAGVTWSEAALGADARFGALAVRRAVITGVEVFFVGTGDGVYRYVRGGDSGAYGAGVRNSPRALP